MSADLCEIRYDVRFRLLLLLLSLERAGISPVSSRDLHAFAYLANVLSPVWNVDPIEESVLKDTDGPHSSVLEREIDHCVGAGLIDVQRIDVDEENDNKLSAWFVLPGKVTTDVLEFTEAFFDEVTHLEFLSELAFSFAEINSERRDDAALVDASWSDPEVANGRIIPFADVVSGYRSAAATAADAFQDYAPKGVILNKAEKLVLYMRLLKRRANG